MSLSAPRVSVVIPSYNHAGYVIEAIDSVRAQSLAEWELIVIDDGSTDGSPALVSAHLGALRDERIRFYLQANAGSHAAINRGLAMARAPYVAILNSDDRFAPTRLERLLDLAAQHPGDLIAMTAVRLIDAEGAAIEEKDPQFWWLRMYRDILDHWWEARAGSRQLACDTLLWGNFSVSTSNFFLSRSLIERIGSLGQYRYVLDWEYALRAAIECPQGFHFLADEPLLDYRLHGNNTILGGAIRNHVEAAHILRAAQKRLGRKGGAITPLAIDRVRYLDRFVRQQLIAQRDSALAEHDRKQAMTEQHVRKLDALLELKTRALGEASEKVAQTQAHVEKLNLILEQEERRIRELQLSERGALAREKTALAEVATLQQDLARMRASSSWRVTAPLRSLGARLRPMVRSLRAVQRRFARAIQSLRLGRRPIPRVSVATGAQCSAEYAAWLEAEDERIDTLASTSAEWLARTPRAPCIGIVVAIEPVGPAALETLLGSLERQIYPHWELCLSRSVSPGQEAYAILERHARRDGRILADRDGADALRGEYLVHLDHQGSLPPHALLRLAQTLVEHREADAVYTDEGELDENGRRCLPHFKPDWSAILLWSCGYPGSLLCVKRAFLKDRGIGEDFSDGYALALRLASAKARFFHLPELLWHRQSRPGSGNSGTAPRAALEAFLRSTYPDLLDRVDDSPSGIGFEPRFKLSKACTASIIIPTKDKIELLAPCIDSILARSSWQNFEILVLDNNSTEPETAAYLAQLGLRDSRIHVVPAPIPFNWSRLNNLGVEHATGDILIFLNNDTLVITPDWLERLMEIASLPDVGTVGPLLLYEDGTVQHAGVVVGMGGWADHVYKSTPVSPLASPFVANALSRNVLACTGACVAIARDTLEALGGFDEAFEICGSDVELGLRAHRSGLQNVYLATVRLSHLESKTRSAHVPEGDFIESDRKYAPYRREGDPFYNPNLDPMASTPTPRHR